MFGTFKGKATINDPVVNGTPSGTAFGTANGFATLDGTGILASSQRFIDAFSAPTNTRAGAGTSFGAGNFNDVFGADAFTNITTGNRNSGFGYQNLRSITNQNDNAAFGYQALRNNIASENTAFGSSALRNNTTSQRNTGFGFNVLMNNLSGTGSNTAAGHQSMMGNTSGSFNTSMGADSLLTAATGTSNAAFGQNALRLNTNPSQNVAMGANSMAQGTLGSNNVGVGYNTLLNNTQDRQTAIGSMSMQANTTGIESTAVGYQSLMSQTIGNSNSAVGHQAGASITTADYNTIFGHGALASATSSSGNVAIGAGSLSSVLIFGNNTALGTRTLLISTSINPNTALGYEAMLNNTLGGLNTAVGYHSLYNNTSGSGNTGMGHDALLSNIIGSSNTAFGREALRDNTASGNTAFGFQAGMSNVAGTDLTALGHMALTLATGISNTGVGANALDSCTIGAGNTGVGANVLDSISTGNNNAGFGNDAFGSGNGSRNTAIGSLSMNLATNVNNNTGVGYLTLSSTTTSDSTAMGAYALSGNTTGADNSAFGFGALRNNIGGSRNTAMGKNALDTNSSGSDNTGMGYNTLTSLTIGSFNVGFGNGALGSSTDANYNSAFGMNSLASNTSGSENAAFGHGALQNVVNQSGNIAFGYFANNGVFTANDTIALGRNTVATAVNAIAIGGSGTPTDAAEVLTANGIAIGPRTSVGAANGIAIGADAVSNVANRIQMGQATNSGTGATLRFRSQIIGDESWISAGTFFAAIDASGNIIKSTTPIAGGGEANTASNVGVGGFGLFKQKTGVNLEFRNINSASSKISVALDAINDEVDLDVVEANVNHNALLNYVANQHVDHSAVVLNAGIGLSGGGNITTSRTFNIDVNNITTEPTPDNADFVPIYDSSAAAQRKVTVSSLLALSTGEANTASNVGTGVGVFKMKTGVDLQFKSITAGSSKLSTTSNVNDVALDVVEANINHNALLNYVANEHVDHSTVSILAGVGLTGGGNITANRTLSLDINGLTTEATPAAGDLLPIYDVSVAAQRKITVSSLLALSGGEANTASNIGVGGVGVFVNKVGVDLRFKNINSGSSKVTITNDAGNNEIDVDVVEANINHNALLNYVANQHVDHSAININAGIGLSGGGNITASRTLDLNITGLTSTTPAAGDELAIYDISLAAHRKITIADIGVVAGGEANTASNQGVGGVGVFLNKVGVDLRFKNINSGSSKVTITNDGANNEIDVDVVDANIDHDALLNFVANEHVDHSAVNITAGVGLSGGGNITASRTIDLNITNLTSTTPVGADEVPIYDISATAPRKVTITQLGAAIGAEANTASNIGVSGVGVFSQKLGVDLQFKNINSGSSKVSVVNDAGNNEIDIDVVEANINHNALQNYVANQHVDHSAVSILSGVGLTGGGDLTATRTLNLNITGLTSTTPAAGDELAIYDISLAAHRKITIADIGVVSGGEANTASNIGVGGVGVFVQKLGVDLQFKNINAGSSKVSITNDAGNNEIDVDVVEANINHNNLLNYVANQHVDHSAVSILAGVGLSGGGNITATRTLDLNINGLTTEAAPVAGDFIPIYDVSATAIRKASISSIVALSTGEANTASNVGGGAGVFKQKTGVDLEFKSIIGSTRLSVVGNTNDVTLDVVTANIDHDALLNFVANEHVDHSTVSIIAGVGLAGGGNITASRTLDLNITGLTSTTPAAGDELAIYDISLAAHRKITIADIGVVSGGEANTASNQGVGGVGVFLNKVGVDLRFKNINTGSSKVTITNDVANNEIDVDIVEANINHNALLNYVANQHVDHSAVNINAGVGLSGGGNITASRTIDLNITNLTTAAPATGDEIPIYDISGTAVRKATIASIVALGGGEANTASNNGAGGVGTFINKVGVDLRFKNINSGSNKVSITDDTINNEIDVDVVEANINHNNLLNYVANQHVDHSAVNITAGVGLSGGGNITATRTIDLNITNLTTTTPATVDEIPIYDSSIAAVRKITIASLQTLIDTGEVNTASNVGTGVGVFKQKTGVNLEFKSLLAGSTKLSTVSNANDVTLDVVEANINHNALLNYVANQHIDHSAVSINAGVGLSGGGNITASRTLDLNITGLTSTTPAAGDELAIYDISLAAHRKITIADIGVVAGGEANTASNQGVGGVGVFLNKVGVDLRFKNINNGSNKVSVTNDGANNEIDIDIIDANIDHNALLNYVANQHVDHSTVNITAGVGLSGGGNITASRTLDLNINGLTSTTPAAGDELAIYDISLAAHRKITIADIGVVAGGEANTASNQGVGGVGVFINKVGVDLRFKNINAGSSKISVTNDGANNEIDIDVVEANVNHNALLNYVANQHVDHSAVNITAGVGLSGGGNITASRTIDLNITNLTVTTPATTDEIPIYDTSATGVRKITIASLQTLIDTGEVNTASNQGVGGVGVFLNKVGVDLRFKNINNGSNKVSITNDVANNEIDVDIVEANINHNALLNYVANQHVDHSTVNITAGIGLTGGGNITASRTIDMNILGLTLEATPVGGDFIAFYDNSVSAHRRATITAIGTAIGAEANTASNIGTAGVGVFDQKVGVDLQFRNINSGSNKVTVTDDGANNEIDIDIVEANINHNNLLNYVANQHVDHSAVNINAGVGLSGGGNITASRTIDLNITNLTTAAPATGDEIPIYDISGTAVRKTTISSILALGTGEANTASNIGVGGVGVFVAKVGVDLRFKNINTGSSKVTITNDVANNEIDVDVVEANINHNALLNYVANQHIDHSAVNITAGVGLSGGGNITASRTIDLNITNLTAAAPATGDEIPMYDISAAAVRKMTVSQLQTLIGGETNTASNVGAGAGVFKQKTGVNLEFKSLIANSTKFSITSNADDLTVDVVEANINHNALLNYVANQHVDHSAVNITAGVGLSGGGNITASRTIDLNITNLTATTPVTADEIPIYDVSATAPRKITIAQLQTLIDTGEVNTASNLGVGGVGVFINKSGVDLRFKNINTGSSKVTVTNDVANNEIDIDIVEANINHNALLNYVANQHVDHSTVNITAGLGLTGGGNITASRTIDLNITNLTATTPVTADEIPIYDVSATAPRKITIAQLQTLIDTGEVNTASNVGVGGVGPFLNKVGVDLRFKNINSGSSKVTVTNDAINSEIDIDIVEANINHNTLLNYVANQHIDHSAVSITAGVGLSGGGNITASRTIDLNITNLTAATPATADEIPIYDVSAAAVRKITIASLQTLIDTGEVNTASNQGVGGVGVFLNKVGVDLRFKNINAGSSKVTITNDAVNNEIDVDIVEANINHNTLLNYVANQHIDHSAVSITAGVGLSGGGNITASRTIDLNITNLTTATPATGDEIAIYDISATAVRKTTLSALQTLIGGETNTASNIGVGGVGVFVNKSGVDLRFKNINAGSNKVSITDDGVNNEIDIDVVEANINHNTLLNYVANQHIDHSAVSITAGVGLSGGGNITTSRTLDLNITGLTATTPATGDEVAIYDISLAAHRKVTLTQLQTLIGGETNTASNLGVGGVGVFISKSGVDLRFKNINNGSTKVSITNDVANNEIDVDVVEANINHNALLNYVANQHIDHSAVSITAGVGLSGGGNITTSRTLDLNITGLTTATPATGDEIAIYDISAAAHRKMAISALQTLIGATASNVGVGGVGVYDGTVGNDLQFKSINSGSSKVSITDDAGNNEIDIDVVEANINHNALLNYVANQHINHSAVSIIAGSGLSGGGDITVSRTLDLNITGLTNATPALADEIPIFDVSATGNRKMTITQLQTLIGGTGEANTASNIGVGGVGVFVNKVGVDLRFKNINNGSTKISITNDVANNEIDVDVVEANVNHNALLNYVANQHIDHSTVSISAGTGLTGGGNITANRTLSLDINGLTTDTPATGDFLAFYDISGADHNKTTIADILNTPSVENLSAAAAGVMTPSVSLQKTFIQTTSAGAAATGTLANGTIDGMMKYIVARSLLANYVLTVTNGIKADGSAMSTITFDSTGQSIELIWSASSTRWFVANTGATMA